MKFGTTLRRSVYSPWKAQYIDYDKLKKLLKDKLATEDEERRSQDDVQKLTDRTVAEIDRLVQAKEAEIMAV